MSRNIRSALSQKVARTGWFVVAILMFAAGWGTTQATAQKTKTAFAPVAVQQPLYGEYKGVRIGMTADEVRAKLGPTKLQGDDQDFYVFSENETVQIAYSAAHKVIAISVDYLEGVGAPDYRAVVGPDIEVRANGSMYKRVDYEQLGFWVSYNRSAGSPVFTVTITIQGRLKP